VLSSSRTDYQNIHWTLSCNEEWYLCLVQLSWYDSWSRLFIDRFTCTPILLRNKTLNQIFAVLLYRYYACIRDLYYVPLLSLGYAP
jgi:hypothetical protein